MKLFIQCMVATILLSSNGCENFSLIEKFYSIEIVNEASESIYFYETSIQVLNPKHYPDTTLSEVKPNAIMIRVDSESYIDSRTKWAEIFKDLPSDTLSIFFFDDQVFENTEWEVIRNNYNILKRYDLSLGDLERLNFTVTYPPDASMEGVKMYPD